MSGKNDRLMWWMQATNALSVLILLVPTIFSKFLVSESFLSRQYDYIHSIEPFLPYSLLNLLSFGGSLPIQTIRIGSLTMYFPGVAVECILGTIQGILLGMDLLRTPRQGNYQTPMLPATALFLYAGMCTTAFPIHCLKDVSVFDIQSDSVVALSLQWLDTCCTSCVPAIALLTGLIESKLADPSYERFLPLIICINAMLTWCGAFLLNRWITFTLHGLVQVFYILPLVHLTNKRVDQLDCTHGFAWMKYGKYVALFGLNSVLVCMAVASVTMQGNFCPLASVFLVSRIAVVFYWTHCKLQAECYCSDKKI